MKKHIPIIALIIGLSSISLTNTLKYKSKLKIYGDWEFEKVKIEGVEKSVSDLNNCGYNDVLQIRRKKEKVIYEFDEIKISGNRIGISKLKICSLSPIVYKYVIVNNSCPTEWIKVENSKNRIVSISEGVVVEYEIKKPNRKKMILTKVREIANYGNQIPDEINLKKVKKEN